ncbi:MAG TPA: ATP-binding protein [Alphaproteobacteria bacterium]|nr:two-component sensor histidine kinase [Rhodospirillaceae bacterium]HRJ12386.1 ATP-binding protein [Alphaproteobacteria bacterium]
MKLFRSRLLPRTLFFRSLLIVITPVVVLQALVAFIFLNWHWEAVTNRLAEAVASEIAFTLDVMDTQPGEDTAQVMAIASKNTHLKFELMPDEKMGRNDPRRQTILSRMIGSAVKRSLPYPARVQLGRKEKTYEIDVMTPRGLLHVTVPERRVFTVSTYSFIIWFSVAAFLLLTISILFLRGQVRPIRRLAEAAEAFGSGVEKSFKVEGAREVRRAGNAFLVMRDRIRRQIAQRTEMLAGVSHDLRTPLTRMKLQLAMMKDKGTDELKSDVTEMEAMIDAYLQFARGEGEETATEIHLNELIAQLAKDAERMSDKNIDLKLIPARATVRPHALRRALDNLVQNALRYATQCGITLERTDEHIHLFIDDNGPGIPESAREDVFRPFFRLEESRNAASGGIGLGLAIARDIILAHGGEIELQDSPMGGLRCAVKLPTST